MIPVESLDLDSYSCPGKVFILGEYAVLDGGDAIVAAVGPRFRLKTGEHHALNSGRLISSKDERVLSRTAIEFHIKSPAALLLQKLHNEDLRATFDDPHEGKGGFGASTAQFALLYRALAKENGLDLRWSFVWKLYRELTRDSGAPELSPSGADLVSQWLGGIVHIQNEFKAVEDISEFFDWRKFLVFSATSQTHRKVATHDHLAQLPHLKTVTPKLNDLVKEGRFAVEMQDLLRMGATLNEYAELLAEAGLEIAATRRDREALFSLPGVAGVKGAGALQADAIVVLMASENNLYRENVIALGRSRGLELLCDGIEFQKGVS